MEPLAKLPTDDARIPWLTAYAELVDGGAFGTEALAVLLTELAGQNLGDEYLGSGLFDGVLVSADVANMFRDGLECSIRRVAPDAVDGVMLALATFANSSLLDPRRAKSPMSLKDQSLLSTKAVYDLTTWLPQYNRAIQSIGDLLPMFIAPDTGDRGGDFPPRLVVIPWEVKGRATKQALVSTYFGPKRLLLEVVRYFPAKLEQSTYRVRWLDFIASRAYIGLGVDTAAPYKVAIGEESTASAYNDIRQKVMASLFPEQDSPAQASPPTDPVGSAPAGADGEPKQEVPIVVKEADGESAVSTGDDDQETFFDASGDEDEDDDDDGSQYVGSDPDAVL